MNYTTYIVGLSMSVCFLLGCSSGDGGAGAEEAAAAVGLSTDMVERAVTLSAQGQTELAVALLLEGAESPETAVAPAASLAWDEAHFKKLAGPALDAAQSENNDVARAARSLRVSAIEAIEKAQADGEGENAARGLQRLDAAGQLLSTKKYNALLNLEGEGFVRVVNKMAESNDAP